MRPGAQAFLDTSKRAEIRRKARLKADTKREEGRSMIRSKASPDLHISALADVLQFASVSAAVSIDACAVHMRRRERARSHRPMTAFDISRAASCTFFNGLQGFFCILFAKSTLQMPNK
jgi:hypothetical protein